jgi:hypothetical protein
MNCPAAGWARRMHAEALIDQAPDRSVVPGYANIDAPWVTYALTSAVVGVTAAAGARALDPDSAWYRGLGKPPWQPPPRAFGVIWPPWYASIAWAGGPDPEPCIKAVRAVGELAKEGVVLPVRVG